jgi:hypothetical protein
VLEIFLTSFVSSFKLEKCPKEKEIVVTATLKILHEGGQLIRCKVDVELTRFDLIAAAIYTSQEGIACTRRSILRHMKMLLQEHGINGFLSIYNKSSPTTIDIAETACRQFFPEVFIEC